jgi:hypothetical protein
LTNRCGASEIATTTSAVVDVAATETITTTRSVEVRAERDAGAKLTTVGGNPSAQETRVVLSTHANPPDDLRRGLAGAGPSRGR